MRKYGCKPNPKDKRDYKLRAPLFRSPPPSVDLKSIVLPVEDQGPLNSCLGNGGATELETMLVKMGKPFTQRSRLAIYYLLRALAGDVDKDEGGYPRDLAKALAKWGAPREELWPYDPSKYAVQPSDEAMQDARWARVKEYYWPNNLSAAKWAMSKGYVVGVGIPIFPSFHRHVNGVVPMPSPSVEESTGGHWIVLCGYNDATGYVDFVNSWGTSWGNKGFGQLPYAFLERYSYNYLVLEVGESKNGEAWETIPEHTRWYLPFSTIARVFQEIWRKIFGHKLPKGE